MIKHLTHLTETELNKVQALDTAIYELQGNCNSMADTLRLSDMYAERIRIIRQEVAHETVCKL